MTSRNWYKRYPADYLAGVMVLNVEQKGAYSTILDMIYDRGAPIPDESQCLARIIGCSVRKWHALKEQLIAMGKIEVKDGFISNKRAEKTLENYAKNAPKSNENQFKNEDKTPENYAELNKNNDIDKKTALENGLNSQTEARNEKLEARKDTNVSYSTAIKEAVGLYNQLADQEGLAEVQRLTDARKQKIRARLKDLDGLEGWKILMEKVRESDFLCGRVKDWKADIDFIIRESSFVKIMEGKYDNAGKNRKSGTNSTNAGQSINDPSVQGFSKAATTHARNKQHDGEYNPSDHNPLYGKTES